MAKTDRVCTLGLFWALETFSSCVLTSAQDGFYFRGVVQHLPLVVDEIYVKSPENDQFLGSDGTLIVNKNDTWRIYMKEKEIAKLRQEEELFGTRFWSFSGDFIARLNFNNCSATQFTCADSTCVPMDDRCNYITSCPDYSDEADCTDFILDTGYFNLVADYRAGHPPRLTNLSVRINVDQVLDMDVNSKRLQLKFSTELHWSDSRLRVLNLQANMRDNAIRPADWQQLWIPDLLFASTTTHLTTASLGPSEARSEVFVRRLAGPQGDNQSRLVQNYVYLGADTEIVKRNSYTIRFICAYDLGWYPFDVQVCNVPFALNTPRPSYVHLHPLGAFIRDTTYLNLNVSHISLYTVNVSNTPEMRLRIEITRDLRPILLSTFVPTMILSVINQYTNFLTESGLFEAILSVNATILMTLTSLFISTLNALPMTTYVKMIEIWLFACFLFPFIVITIHVLIFIIGSSQPKACKYLETFGKYILPIIQMMFVLIYFAVGLSNVREY